MALEELGIVHRVQYLVNAWHFGKYFILDFYLPEYNLCLEVDGQSHRSAEAIEKDARRSEILKTSFDIDVVRLDNEQVNGHLITLHLLSSMLRGRGKKMEVQPARVPHRLDSRLKYKTVPVKNGIGLLKIATI